MKIGDRVRTVKAGLITPAGATGTLVAIAGEMPYPLIVKMDMLLPDTLNNELMFKTEELEVVTGNELQQEFTAYVTDEFDRLKNLFSSKNLQYGASDPLQNFRTSARMNQGKDDYEAMFKEAWGFMSKHIALIANEGINARHGDESLGDIAVYAVILKFMIEKSK